MSSKKRSYGQGVALSAMSTGALMKKARSYQAAKAVRNRAPRIKGAITGRRAELKFVDTAISQEINTTGVVTPVNLIAVGDDYNTRDGREAYMKSVQIHLRITKSATNLIENGRVMLVWDNAVNSGAAPAVLGTILDNTVVTDVVNCFPSINNSQRFSVLYDNKFALGPFNTTATQALATDLGLRIDAYKQLNVTTQYSNTTAAIASIQNGALYLITLGTIAAGSASSVTGGVRVRFTDQ